MKEVMEVLKDMKEIEKTLVCWLKEETCKGKKCFDLPAASEIADIIKDISEAGEKCMKKKYYEMLICEMMQEDEDMDEVGVMGYDHWSYARSGRYAPKGRGTYSPRVTGPRRAGYIPDPDMRDVERIPGQRIHAPFPYNVNMPPMGYPMDNKMDTEPIKMGKESRYGDAYDRYKDQKKHYTETRDEHSHHEMNEHIKESARDSLAAMKDMWSDASPEVKQTMRNGMETLLNEMKKG